MATTPRQFLAAGASLAAFSAAGATFADDWPHLLVLGGFARIRRMDAMLYEGHVWLCAAATTRDVSSSRNESPELRSSW